MATHDMDKSDKMYGGFISALKWTVPAIFVITMLIIMLIAE